MEEEKDKEIEVLVDDDFEKPEDSIPTIFNPDKFSEEFPEIKNNRYRHESDNNELYAHTFKNDPYVLENVAVECFLECISRFNLAISYSKQPKLISDVSRSKAYISALKRVIAMQSETELGSYVSPSMQSRHSAYKGVQSAKEGAYGAYKIGRDLSNRFGNEFTRRANQSYQTIKERAKNASQGGKFTLRRSKKSRKSRRR